MKESKSQLKTNHRVTDCLYWNIFAAIPFITASIAIADYSIIWVLVYIFVFMFHFLVVGYRFFCSHCPHYIRSTRTTKCMFIWGIPKYFKSREGPLSLFEKIMVLTGLIVIVLFPMYWLLLQPHLLIIYSLSWAVLGLTIKRYECIRCIHFHCPVNSVPEELKKVIEKNGYHREE